MEYQCATCLAEQHSREGGEECWGGRLAFLIRWPGKASSETFQQRLEAMRSEPHNRNSQCKGPEVPKRDLPSGGDSKEVRAADERARRGEVGKDHAGPQKPPTGLWLLLSAMGSHLFQEDGMSWLVL